MRFPALLLLAALTLAASRPAGAQALPASLTDPGTAPLRFERITVEHGLSQGSVYAIFQDRRGFLWFGTQAGIDRYDGYRFTSYKRAPFDPGSISGGFVSSFYEDDDGILWAGAGSLLNRFDPSTERFTHHVFDWGDGERAAGGATVFSITGGSGDVLWLGTARGIVRLHTPTAEYDLLRHDPADPASMPHPLVFHVYRDHEGRLWAATGNGLARIDESTGRLERFLHDPTVGPDTPAHAHSFSHIRSFAGQSDVLWLASGEGLVRFDTRDGSTRRFVPDASRAEGNGLLWLAPDPQREGVLWITSEGAGLLRFDERTGRFESYRHDGRDPYSLLSDEVMAAYTDRSGIVWLGDTRGLGLSKFDPSVSSIRHYRSVPGYANSLPDPLVFSIAEGEDNVFWIGTMRGGVSRFDRARNLYTHYRHDPRNANSITSDYVRTVLRDHEGMIWVGTDRGLNRIDPRTSRITRFTHDPDDPGSLGANFVRRIYEDREGTLWVAALGTLNRFDRETGMFTRFGHAPERSPALPSRFLVLSMHEDSQGDFWIGWGGLVKMDRAAGTFETYPHDPADSNTPGGTAVWAIHEREREPGVLWVASYDGALTRFDTQSTTFRHFGEKDGLANSVLYGLVEDDEGMLWMSSNRGLSRFDPDTETFRNYDVDSGLQGQEFNAGAYYKSPSGEVFFGGVNGLNSFFPHELRDNVHPPQVVLTGLKLFNQPLVPGEGSPLRQMLSHTDEVRLRHTQNMLTFEFAALHFRHPARNRYAYRLEGLDEEWVHPDGQRLASYANLAPGTYTFRVRAANSDGVWNDEGAALRVVIRPPWWRTAWAYGLYFMIFCLGVVSVDRVQRRRLLAKEREKARQRELTHAREIEQAYHDLERAHARLKAAQAQLVQQEKLASLGALTAGIAHEIKNPLNFVNNFAELNQELAQEILEDAAAGRTPAELGELLRDLAANSAKIAEHGQRADGIVRSMLEHSRGGSGKREAVDLNALVEEYVGLAYHGKRAQVPDFNAEVVRDLDEAVGEVDLVPQEIGRVLLNLVGNALDAVHELAGRANGHGGGPYEPRVEVSTRRVGGAVEVRVSDNGPGIPDDVRARVFEPFFTTKPAGSGTGLGLSLSHDIVTSGHGGRLELESAPGEGTAFTVILPNTEPVTDTTTDTITAP